MKQLTLLALSLVMVLSLAACGGDRTNGGSTNGGMTNGTTNGTTNGATNGTTNGTTNGAANGTTNGTGGTVTGPVDGDHRDVIGSDLDDMVRDGVADDRDGDLNREP